MRISRMLLWPCFILQINVTVLGKKVEKRKMKKKTWQRKLENEELKKTKTPKVKIKNEQKIKSEI